MWNSRWTTTGLSTAWTGYRRAVRILHPSDGPEVDPVEAYLGDDRPAPPGRPWVVVNMVASMDGATTVAGRSGGLGGTGDRHVFQALRGLADMVLVGAGTVRAEGYRPPQDPAGPVASRRAVEGRAPRPRLVVVSGSLDLDPTLPLFAENDPGDPAPLVATVSSSPADRRAALEPLAELVVCGETLVDLTGLLATLNDIGARTVLCEGGPHLNHQLFAAGLVDELCVSISPMLVGGVGLGGRALLDGPSLAVPIRLGLHRVLSEDGFLFSRYLVS